MSSNLKDILSHLQKDVEQDKLLEYLNKELNETDQHAVEEALNDDPFASDAMDGLQQFTDTQSVSQAVSQLNNDLKNELNKKKKRKRKTAIPEQTWAYVTLAIILIACIVAYLVIRHATS